MVYRGQVANGIIQLEGSVILPEGAVVRVELATDPRDEEFHVGIDRELDRLASLPANWDHEGAPQIDPAIIRAARDFIARLPRNVSPIPAVVPSAAGNLQFEWNARRRSLELEIESPATIHYLKWDPSEEVEEEDVFDIEDTDRAVHLIQWFVTGSRLMPDPHSQVLQVDPAESLLRALDVPDWWNLSVDPPRPRSFAFKVNSPFSVNIASLIGLEGAVRHMSDVLHCPDGGIVSFNCGQARSVGFDARHELDPQYLDTQAHANVYYSGSSSRRKRDARAPAEMCETVHRPRF